MDFSEAAGRETMRTTQNNCLPFRRLRLNTVTSLQESGDYRWAHVVFYLHSKNKTKQNSLEKKCDAV